MCPFATAEYNHDSPYTQLETQYEYTCDYSNDSVSIQTSNGHTNVSHVKLNDIIDTCDNLKFDPSRNIVSLFRAVIMQSLIDIVSNSKRTEDKLAKRDAIDWMQINNPDFNTVCLFANLSPKWVLQKAMDALERERVFRNEREQHKRKNSTRHYRPMKPKY